MFFSSSKCLLIFSLILTVSEKDMLNFPSVIVDLFVFLSILSIFILHVFWFWISLVRCIRFVVCYVMVRSDQIRSVTQSCPTLCDPMNRSTPGLPVHHQLLEFTETHLHWVSDAIQPSHPLSSPSPPAPNPSQHQSLFQWVNSSHEVAKVLVSWLFYHYVMLIFYSVNFSKVNLSNINIVILAFFD